jgi:ribosomal protein L7/L12
MAKAERTTSPKSDQPLGTLIAAVLAHPDTPEKIYSGIVDAVNELMTRDVCNDSRFIQSVIEKTNEQGKVDVTLVSCGNNKIETVKEFTGLSLQDAKAMVDGVPSILKEGVNKEEAEDIKKKLEEQEAVSHELTQNHTWRFLEQGTGHKSVPAHDVDS